MTYTELIVCASMLVTSYSAAIVALKPNEIVDHAQQAVVTINITIVSAAVDRYELLTNDESLRKLPLEEQLKVLKEKGILQ